MNDIRVTYSGLISFFTSIFSTITGLIFVIIVTRQLEPEEFGLWTLIGSLITYVVIAHPVISYWTTRQISRGIEVGKTALFTSGIFSVVGFGIYAVVALYVSSTLGAPVEILFLASFLIPLNYLNNIISSISLGFKPQIPSYGLASFELAKLPLGFIFVYYFEFGLIGALFTIILANSVKLIILIVMTREKFFGAIKRDIISFWLKMSWLTGYQNIPQLLNTLDVLLYTIFIGSYVGLAFWAASQTISYLVIHSSKIYQGLLPKLLATEQKAFAETSINRTLFFGLPIFAFSIIFAKPGLHILNPLYVESVNVIYFLSTAVFFNVIRTLFFEILAGYDKVDVNLQSSFRNYIKSKLFFIPTLNLIYSFSFVVTLAIFLILFSSNFSELEVIEIWALIMLCVTIPFTIYTFIVVQREHKISFPIKKILKYGFATLFSSLISFILLQKYLTFHESIFEFLPELIPYVIFAGLLYFGLLFVIDSSTRKLYRQIIQELRR